MAASLYTLADLRRLALTRVEANSIFFSTFEVDAIINEAIRCVNLFTGFNEGVKYVPGNSVAGQQVYAVPPGILYPLRVQFEDHQLDPVPLQQIGQDYYTWATDTTSKLGPVARWVPMGVNLFAIHPIDSLGGQSIAVTGVLETPLLVNDTDPLPIEEESVELIMEYCAHRLPLKEGGSIFSVASKLYQKLMKTMKVKTIFQEVKFPAYFVRTAAPVVAPQGE